MMEHMLETVLNMSVTGSLVILAVLPVRLCLKRAPKLFSYALWAVVLFRLLCPVSLSAPISVLPQQGAAQERMEYVALEETGIRWEPVFFHGGEQPRPEAEPNPEGTANPLPALWLAGVAAIGAGNLVLLLRLRRRLVGAMHWRDNVFLADDLPTPFVLGVFQPNIYLPSDLEDPERGYVLRHERHHIRRLDHITRLLAFGAVCIHWFNPLVWLAYLLSCRDMELSCDEAVLGSLREDLRADYSYTLLHMTTGKRFPLGTPLAFGEGDTKERVKNIMKFRKPKALAVILSLVLCITLTACLSANPETLPEETILPLETVPVEIEIQSAPYSDPRPLTDLIHYPPEVSGTTEQGAELLYADDHRIIFYCYDTNQLIGYDFVEEKVFLCVRPFGLLSANAAMPSREEPRGIISISPDGNTILLHEWTDNVCRRTFKLNLAAGTYQVMEGGDNLKETFVFPENQMGELQFGPTVESMRYTNGSVDCYIFRSNALEYDGPGPLEDVLMDAIDLDTPTGVGFELAYEDGRAIIFYGSAGLYGYDLVEEKLTFAIDVKKLMGVEAQIQGTGPQASVRASRDGKTLMLWHMELGNQGQHIVYQSAVIDLQEWTYSLDTTYRVFSDDDAMMERFDAFDPWGDGFLHGYVFPGIDLGTTCYIRGEQKWYPFR